MARKQLIEVSYYSPQTHFFIRNELMDRKSNCLDKDTGYSIFTGHFLINLPMMIKIDKLTDFYISRLVDCADTRRDD